MSITLVGANSQYLTKTGGIGLVGTGYPFTCMCWARPAAASVGAFTHPHIITDVSEDDENFSTGTWDDSFWYTQARTTGSNQNNRGSNVAVQAGVWACILATYTDATHRNFWVDNVDEGSSTSSCAPSGMDCLTIGAVNRAAGVSQFYSGDIAHVAYWPRILTANERFNLMAGHARPGDIWGCAMWYPCDIGNPGRDVAGGYDLTLNNGPVTAGAVPPCDNYRRRESSGLFVPSHYRDTALYAPQG